MVETVKTKLLQNALIVLVGAALSSCQLITEERMEPVPAPHTAKVEWFAVDAYHGWKTSKGVNTSRANTAVAWRAYYRVDLLGDLELTCQTLPTPEGLSGISLKLEYSPPRVFVGRGEAINFEIKVDGRVVDYGAILSDDADSGNPVHRTLAAFLEGSEAELRTWVRGELRSSTISLNGFREAFQWLLANCGTAAERRS